MSLFFRASHMNIFIISCVAILISFSFAANEEVPPNVLIIMTDEHNLRTLGCYRDLMVQSQAEIWGEGITVSTPNIDSLAKEGALLSNFLTVSPRCTPSRGSFLTGEYPSTHGAEDNHVPMNNDAITFAKILKDRLEYSASYMGKWHLNGELKDTDNFGAPADRSFGFDDTKYQWNRGHWKFIKENDDGTIKGYEYEDGKKIFDNQKRRRNGYSTDFLTNRAIEYITDQAGSATPFTLMLSYPDPHGTFVVREPYNTMFDDLHFAMPQSALSSLKKQPAPPAWSKTSNPPHIPNNTTLDTVEEEIELYENSTDYQDQQRQTFGMIKLLDDNIGRLLKTLKDKRLEDNTVVIFTSDHGGAMAEHNNKGKQTPYKTSAGVPFVIRWPVKIPAGKHIQTAYSSVDFVPTLLNLLGIDTSEYRLPGLDFSGELMNEATFISDENQLRFIDMAEGRWAAAVSQRYKFILSPGQTQPYLLDTTVDPDELTNFFNLVGYKEQSDVMKSALLGAMKEYNFQLRDKSKSAPVYLDAPPCQESRDQLDEYYALTVCTDYKKKSARRDECQNPLLKSKCPITCNDSACFEEYTRAAFVWKNKTLNCAKLAKKSLKKRREWCKTSGIRKFCRVTCRGKNLK